MRPFVNALPDYGSVALGALVAVIGAGAIIAGLMTGHPHPIVKGVVFLLVGSTWAMTAAAKLRSRPWRAQAK